MAQGMQQTQTLGLHQTLAPQLQQSLAILQAPMMELQGIIRQEMESNPILEEETPEKTPEEKTAEDEAFKEEFEQLAKLDEEWRDYMTQSNSYQRSEEDEERRQHFFDSIVNPETLQQHLLSQVPSADLSSSDAKLAELIIGNLDDFGFLQSPPEEMSRNTGVDVEDFQRVLDVIRTFDPAGVGALDLRDCLLIQLRRLGKEGSLEYRILDQHLDEMARRRYPDLARKLGTTVDHIQRAAQSIATLDPKPGQIFSSDPHQYVIPDVTVEKIGDTYTLSLNGDQIPHLRISNTYKDLMAQRGNTDGVKDYIREKIRSGKFLIKSIHQRQQTISNIAQQIVDRQHDFLENGPSQLRPMTMAQVAAAVGVHETTVSRAISSKFIATPRGVFEMKYFFTPGYKTAEGENMSNTSVKEAITEMVKNEDARRPLSDAEIVDSLKERGIPIARRTVAKYRAEANILPSNMRRQY